MPPKRGQKRKAAGGPYRAHYRRGAPKRVPRRRVTTRPLQRIENPNVRMMNTWSRKQMISVKKTLLTTFTLNSANTGTGAVSGLIPTSNFPDFSSYSGVFDEYMITKAKFIFNLRTIDVTDDASITRILIGPQHNSNTTVPTVSTMQDEPNIRDVFFTDTDRRFEITVVPFALSYVYAGVTPEYKKLRYQWVETTSGNDVTYYAIQYFPINISTNQFIDVDLEVTVKYRGQQ